MSKLDWQFQTIPSWASNSSIVCSDYVKLIDPPIINPCPQCKVIGRVYLPDYQTNAMIARGAGGVSAWWGAVSNYMLSRPYVWAWELPNEPQAVSNWLFCQALAAFTKEAAKVMHSYGLLVIGGNLAEGNPGGDTDQERSNLFCYIADGLQYCDYWSQHAYWVPDGYNHKEAGYNKWHALRYKLNTQYANDRGIKLPPVILTEGGWDFSIVGKSGKGWHSYTEGGWDRYLSDLKRFDTDLMSDDNVLGCTLFVSGANDDWNDYEINEACSISLAAYIKSTQTAAQPIASSPSTTAITIARPLPRGQGKVSQTFGANVSDYLPLGFAGHEGIDYSVKVGVKVLSCGDGVVYYAGPAAKSNERYGTMVIVDHNGGEYRSWYCHLNSVEVIKGQLVKQGQLVGYSGNTGASTGPHLHFGIQVPTAVNGSKGFVDPWGLRVMLGDA